MQPSEDGAKDRKPNPLFSQSENPHGNSEIVFNIYADYVIEEIQPAELAEKCRICYFAQIDPRAPLPPGKENQAVWSRGWSTPHAILPMGYANLPFELAKVEFGDDQSVLEFVSGWGTLGFDTLIHEDASARFDPLWFIWWHARTVKDVLNLYAALQDGDDDSISREVKAITQPRESEIHQVESPTGYHIEGTQVVPTTLDLGEPIEEQALELIRSFVTGNIANVNPVIYIHYPDVAPFSESGSPLVRLNFTVKFGVLIEAVWWHLANLVFNIGEIGRCEDCGSYFERTPRNSQFCLPPDGHIRRMALNKRRALHVCVS